MKNKVVLSSFACVATKKGSIIFASLAQHILGDHELVNVKNEGIEAYLEL